MKGLGMMVSSVDLICLFCTFNKIWKAKSGATGNQGFVSAWSIFEQVYLYSQNVGFENLRDYLWGLWYKIHLSITIRCLHFHTVALGVKDDGKTGNFVSPDGT